MQYFGIKLQLTWFFKGMPLSIVIINFFYLSFSFKNIHNSQDSRGRGRVSL